MSPFLVVSIIVAYFLMLILVAHFTNKKSSASDFYTASKSSPWYVVAFGMIGASLSGVTFISIPGWVGVTQFSYMQVVFGYLLGYLFIAFVLMPLYYKLNLTTIYTYFLNRVGPKAHKTASLFFILSRVVGASFRLYLVAMVLQLSVFEPMNLKVPFFVIVAITVGLIWLYTQKGGIKTIVYTDTLQTLFMLLSVGITIYFIGDSMQLSLGQLFKEVANSEFSKTFFFDDVNAKTYFWKQFLSGAFIAVVMTGMDQDMMQKNLTCKSIGDAQKNLLSMSFSLVFVNLMFLSLGALLFVYANKVGFEIPEKTDALFPTLAMNGSFGTVVAISFILGLVAAAYSSADSALTSLTTSFSLDILNLNENNTETRNKVHLGFSILLVLVITAFGSINNESVISELFTVAGFTYGPILGMFAFGLISKHKTRDELVPIVAVLAPILSYVLKVNSETWFNGYKFGFELLIVNGALTFFGMHIIRLFNKKSSKI